MTEERQTEVLIIGCGNIGRVYGYHLFKGGAKIHFYVREHHRENLTKYPLRMHRLSSPIRFCNKSSTEKFSDYTITTDTDIANGNAPNLPEQLDYVIFAVPINRFSEGDWLKTLITFLNNKYQKNVYYACPVPDETRMQRIVDMGIDKSQLISGQTNTCSYFAPLANQKIEPRGKETAKKDSEDSNPNKVIVYCTTSPECLGQLTEEAKDATDKLVKILNKGGLNTVNVGKDTEYGLITYVGIPVFVGFAMYDWNLLNAGKDIVTMTTLTGAISETAQIVMKKTNNQCNSIIKMIPFIPTLLFCFALIVIHFFSLYVSSFDIEAFCNAHFNVKLNEQTDYGIEFINREAEEYNVSITNFQTLLKKYKDSVKKDE
ncbi:hypothetical protein BCR32DRAFT_268382 [Anaeromyces robustus]|uniref:Ketopantoate reductase N-terminal domain-containing protein n=1 Tax=Anaeromyces robustus TaxID=1754192 RepID=A0A1Y1X6C5_9FUNG|nr:hypothetical protein BCR32DRAFT_268382 [Anaeromyces robustus]|eukprot:ORX81228.1 hypothetical protein BCR32DRAFT_268382 [Anaeromyces robustus]